MKIRPATSNVSASAYPDRAWPEHPITRSTAIGKNTRYESHYDALNDMRIEEAAATLTPTTLPVQAYGRQEIEWTRPGVQVWVWISWADGAATRIPAVATGWNDRVVCVEWEARGGRRSCIVWRNAATRRTA